MIEQEDFLKKYLSARRSIGRYAKQKHNDTGIKRKFTGEPYWEHPKSVSKVLAVFGAPERLIRAGFCHDLIEDAGVTWDDLYDESDSDIADIVSELTNDKEDLKKLGKEVYMNDKLIHLSSDALTIKLADNYCNLNDRPTEDQRKRILNNVRFLKRNRKLNKIQKELVNAILNR